MPAEIFGFIILIVVLSFIFGGIVIKWQNDLKREQLRAGSDQNSLGTGELREIIQEAMEEAVSPLEERLDLIEQNMRRLPEHSEMQAVQDPGSDR